MEVKSVFSSDSDVLAVEVTDNRKCPEPIRVTLRVLRFASQYDKGKRPYQYPGTLNDDAISIVRTLEHKALSKLSVLEDCTILTQEFTERDFYCKSAVAISIFGRKSKIKRANEMEYTITAEPKNGTFMILISSASKFDETTVLSKAPVMLSKLLHQKVFESLLNPTRSVERIWNDGS